MIRLTASCLLVAALGVAAGSVQAVDRLGSRSYEVELKIARDGVLIPSPVTGSVTGESLRFDLACPRCGTLRVHQRVTQFPGTGPERVLVELELFQVRGVRVARLVAPTLGVKLGESQRTVFKTDIGMIEISARVQDLGEVQRVEPDVQTIPADEGLNQWLQRPAAQPRPLSS